MTQTPCGLVTLLTDFGLGDPFVGVMKGVLDSVDPALRVIDLSHGIRQGAIGEGAFWLERSYRYFSAGTVHCAVIDPGVGSARGAVVVAADGHFFVGPDNGLLAEVVLRAPHVEVRQIDQLAHGLFAPSHTFHGRDVFSVIAGRLAAGQLSFAEVGPAVQLQVPTPIAPVVREGDAFVGCVLTADHFGNLITSLRAADVLRASDAAFRLQIADRQLRSVRTFADAEPAELVALVGSFGAVEVIVRDGSALEQLTEVVVGPGPRRFETVGAVRLFPS
ncbi:MAG TPA: SAM-dependent chlorinase/fluorinase [Polyangiaceae bacterium]|nr:SAM-dependent chlorinase/fluorinase [Polyangiaceae bacterium]